MNTYGKRHCPDPTRQDGTQSAESLVAQEAIASLIKRVGDLEKKGKLPFDWYRLPRTTVYLDKLDTTELEAVKQMNKAFASKIVSQQKQIKKLFALTTKMRAFCIRGVHESTNQYKHWGPGRSSSVWLLRKIRASSCFQLDSSVSNSMLVTVTISNETASFVT